MVVRGVGLYFLSLAGGGLVFLALWVFVALLQVKGLLLIVFGVLLHAFFFL